MQVTELYRPPITSRGHISFSDANFIDQIIRERKPTNSVEVGVASGCSSAAILNAIIDSSNGKLFSFDIMKNCYFSEDLPVGYAVKEMNPFLSNNWHLYKEKSAVDAAKIIRESIVDFAFIDGNHYHPWPILDFIALLPLLRNDSCIVFHDISASIANRFNIFGPKIFFDNWPYQKFSHDNIGFVYMPENKELAKDYCLETLKEPWQVQVNKEYLHSLGLYSFYTKESSSETIVVNRLKKIKNKEISIWGAGYCGQRIYDLLELQGIRINFFIDSDIKKQGSLKNNISIFSPEFLFSLDNKPFVVIGSSALREIKSQLNANGYQDESDFLNGCALI